MDDVIYKLFLKSKLSVIDFALTYHEEICFHNPEIARFRVNPPPHEQHISSGSKSRVV